MLPQEDLLWVQLAGLWVKVQADWDAWSPPFVGDEDVVRLILDGTVVLSD